MKTILNITCSSFTCLMLLFALLSPYGLAPHITSQTVYQGLLLSVSVSLFMAATKKTREGSLLSDALIRVLICYFVVFLEGSLIKMIPFSWKGLLLITPVLIPVFIITYFINYLTCVELADSINKSIKRKK